MRNIDPCVYLWGDGKKNMVLVGLYVDDLFIAGNNEVMIDRLNLRLKEKYKI